jgi:hypothetical protein
MSDRGVDAITMPGTRETSDIKYDHPTSSFKIPWLISACSVFLSLLH